MITRDEMIQEIRRELAMRKIVYPNRISRGKMTRSQANLQYTRLEAAMKDLEGMKLREINVT